jgi:hypothetical protein
VTSRRDSIRLLAERRAALITAAVTGQIAVREATVYPEAGERAELRLAAEGRAGYGASGDGDGASRGGDATAG